MQAQQTANPHPAAAGRGTGFGLVGYIIESRTSPGGRLACRLLEEADFYGSQLLIQKLPTTVTAAIIAAAVTATIVTAPAITAAVATAIDTARRRRRRRNIDLAAGRRSDLAAAATVIATAAPVIAVTRAHRTKECGTEQGRGKQEAKCFGFGWDGGSSKYKSCREHDRYPA
jgi:hypothetical protein